MNSIFHRTSVRQYETRQVEEEKIERILRAAMAAPSAGNQQPWEFYVVTDKEKLEQLSKSSPYAGCTKDAPMAFVVCSRRECMMPTCAPLDLSAAVENMLLQADELELGAVWLAVMPVEDRMNQVRDILSIPEALEAFAIVPCGYPLKVKPQQERFDSTRIHYVK